jgi:sugar transferase (PEP-CTERM system associated)
MNSRVIGTYDQLVEIARRERIDKIVIAMSDRRGKLPVEALLVCKLLGVDVEDMTTFHERVRGEIMLESMQPSGIIFSSGFSVSPLLRLLKRVTDIGLSGLGLLLTAPLIPVIAVLIKLESYGPVLFAQERMGQNGKPFMLYKFRSMRVDAEVATGPVFAVDHDDRITRVGRLLRTTRLDELPQLFNILKGDMSFVGPRPERPFFVEHFQKDIPYYIQRLSVKPGLTGWAQVNYAYCSTTEDTMQKLRLDLYYIKHMSLLLDLSILLRTVKTVMLRQGAR